MRFLFRLHSIWKSSIQKVLVRFRECYLLNIYIDCAIHDYSIHLCIIFFVQAEALISISTLPSTFFPSFSSSSFYFSNVININSKTYNKFQTAIIARCKNKWRATKCTYQMAISMSLFGVERKSMKSIHTISILLAHNNFVIEWKVLVIQSASWQELVLHACYEYESSGSLVIRSSTHMYIYNIHICCAPPQLNLI